MLSPQDLTGCHTALITPLTERDGALVVDEAHLLRLVREQVDAGVSGLLFAGTTGQSATLTQDEAIALTAAGAAAARDRAAALGRTVQIIGSAGSNATQAAIDGSLALIEAVELDAVLHVTGYYNNPPQEGLRRHFEVIADACGARDVPVILYNVPSRTASDLALETTVALSRHPAILAVKEASGDVDKVRAILEQTDRDSFAVLSGEDHLVAEIMRHGGVGVISASANRWPREFQRVTELAAAGEHDAAAELQAALLPCVQAVFAAKNPIPLHAMFDTRVRLPLVDLDALAAPARDAARAKIDAALAIEDFPHLGG